MPGCPISGALFAPDVRKPQISPLRFAPVEMTKLSGVADQAFLNLIFIPLGGLQAHERFYGDSLKSIIFGARLKPLVASAR